MKGDGVTQADETLIGEGVVLDTAAATLGARTASALIDGVTLLTLFTVTFIPLNMFALSALDYAAATALVITHVVGVFVAVPVAVETLTRGRSVGKAALGIRIVRDDGGPIAFRQALSRGLLAFFELWITVGAIALIASVTNQRGKRVGDLLAGTYALQVRASKSQHSPLEVAPSLAAWADTIDIRRLPDGLALTVRQFLTRAPGLHPSSRDELGRSLAAELMPFVSPVPPAGTHPEAMLSTVLAVRRDREYAIAVANQEADADQAERIHRLPMGVPDVP